MPQRSALVTIAIVVAAIAGVIIYFSSGDSKSSKTTNTTQPLPVLTSTTLLTGPAGEVRDLLAKGDRIDRHAVYTSSDNEGAVTMTVWRKAGQSRYDTRTTAPDGSTSDTVFLRLKDHAVQCARKGSADFVCFAIAVTDTDPFTLITGDLSGQDVTTTDDTIDGRAVKCYSVTTEEGLPASLCVTPDGIPVRLTSGASTMTLTTLDQDTSGASFDPPAEPGVTPANNFSDLSS